jgi:8-oxo-dGTP pyrophosphatase MutT (NUDIX family)
MKRDLTAGANRVGPWTRLSTRPIYSNPWIEVREDQVVHPDGSPGIFGVVHFTFRPVAVVPIDERGRVTLVGQHRYGIDRYTWEIPQGGCHDGDTLEGTAARELREETGFIAGRWDYLGHVAVSDSITDEVGHIFLARDLQPGPPEPEGSEQLSAKTMDITEAYRMAMEGELVEAITVAGLSRATYFLQRKK